MKSHKENILRIITSAIEAVKPSAIIPQNVILEKDILSICGNKFDLTEFEKIFVVGMGKASSEMARVLELILNNKIQDGIVVTKENHSSPTQNIKTIESSHPFPDARSLSAGKMIINVCLKAQKNDLVIVLISGGASVLAESLIDGISLEEWIFLNKFLVNSGASIQEINIIRKKLSQIKNGGLLNFIHPAKSVALIISDIIGNPIEFIGSSPTFYKNIIKAEVQEIVEKYKLNENFSNSFLEKILSNEKTEIKNSCKNFIIADNEMMLNKAKEIAENLGYQKIIVEKDLSGNVEEISKKISVDMISNKNTIIIYGGETTVKVKGSGKGGRNQELALRVLNELKDSKNEFVFASIGSDGTDGITEAAGAIVTSEILKRNKKILEIPAYLENNNSYEFHKKLKSLIISNPTKTNVMDIMIGYLK